MLLHPVWCNFITVADVIDDSQVRVEIESLADGVDLSEPLTRARFEELNNDLFRKTLGPVKKVRTYTCNN
jgi:molecular chaperone DnaK (HSP70)